MLLGKLLLRERATLDRAEVTSGRLHSQHVFPTSEVLKDRVIHQLSYH